MRCSRPRASSSRTTTTRSESSAPASRSRAASSPASPSTSSRRPARRGREWIRSALASSSRKRTSSRRRRTSCTAVWPARSRSDAGKSDSVISSTKDREGLQKIDLKLLLEGPPGLDPDFLLAIFGRWRLEQGQEIVDLADYAHVDRGPSCILISHRWHFGVTFTEGEPGLLYSARKGLSGTDEDRVLGAARALVTLARRLIAEPEFPREVRPD